MTDDNCFIDYDAYDANLNDFDKGVRGLKQMWRMLASHYAGDPEYADMKFARYTTKFLDRMGFHAWTYGERKTKPNTNSNIKLNSELSKVIYMNEMNENWYLNCALNYGEPYGYDVNTIICYSPWGIRQYCKRQCQAKTRLWLVRPVAYVNGDIVDESVNTTNTTNNKTG